MLDLKVILRQLAVIAIVATFVSSCANESDEVETLQITDEMRTKLGDLGFNTFGAEIKNVFNPITGETSTQYILEGDIALSEDQIADMLASDFTTGAVGEQYRTSNLVTGLPRTITIIGYTGSCCALTSKMRTALQWAVNNYNRLNTGLNFPLTFGTNYQNKDITVYNNGASGGGGSAGFPFSNGDPYNFVQINAGTNSFDTNVVEHVMTHEIGHCLGLRHTDYFNRSLSCGTGGNEGSGGVGAILIPGTPSGFDPNSIMLSCFSSSEDGEFGQFDIVALETLY